MSYEPQPSDESAAAIASPTPAATLPPTVPETPAVTDELAILDQLEADMTAVEQAITTLDRISADGVSGDQVGAEIAAAVSAARFGDPAAPDTPGTPGTPGAEDTV